VSYCRFSCDGGLSDVYVYEDFAHGYVTHVASQRRVSQPDLPYPYDLAVLAALGDDEAAHAKWKLDVDAYFAARNIIPVEDLPAPHAGTCYRDDGLEDLMARLTELRDCGIHVPEHAFDTIRHELENPEPQNGETT